MPSKEVEDINRRIYGNYTLTLSQTSPGFYVSAVQVFCKILCERRNCS